MIKFYVHNQLVGSSNDKMSLKETFQKLKEVYGNVVAKVGDYVLEENLFAMASAIEDGYLFSDSALSGTYEAHFNDDGSVTYDIAYGYPVGYGLSNGPWKCPLEEFNRNFFVQERI